MNWPMTSIENIAALSKYACVGGPFGSKLTGKDYVSEGVPVIRGANMGERFISNDDFVFVTESKVNKDLFGNLAHPGDVVFTQRGTLGQVSLVPENAKFDRYVVSQSQMKLTVDKNKADAKFIYYFFSSKETAKKILNYASSSGVPHINLTVLRNFEIPLPQLEQQKEIAKTLSNYDDLIENNKRRIELLEESARQLYKEWFVRFRFPGHEHVKIIDGVPEGWQQLSIFDVWDIAYGKNLPTARISEKGKYPVHGADSIIGYFEKKNVDESLCLITCRGNGSGNVRRTFGEAFVTNNSFILRPKYKSDIIHFHYAYFSMLQLRLQELRTGAAQPQLTLSGINHLMILIAPEKIMDSYNQVADFCFKQIDNLRKQNEHLASTRDILLPKLMSGEIAV